MSDSEDEEGETKYTIVYDGSDPNAKPQDAVDQDGVARATFDNGDTYYGMYKDRKRNGRGEYTFGNGAKFEGEYVNNEKSGQGVMNYTDGGKYTGEWKNNKRHGFGTYLYLNGDSYTGQWQDGTKHGQGRYVFADNGSIMTGTWIKNRCITGEWQMHDKSRYVGKFANNVPAGAGLYLFSNRNIQSGQFVENQWRSSSFNSPSPIAPCPKPVKATPFTWACRAIDKAHIISDHYEGMNQLTGTIPVKEIKGIPNFRRAGDSAVYGGAQPTLKAIKDMSELMEEEAGNGRILWLSLRDTPVVYVDDLSFTSRARNAVSRPMTFADIPRSDLPKLDQVIAEKVTGDIRATGGLLRYGKLAMADQEEDVKVVPIVLEVKEKAEDEESEEMDEKKEGVLPVYPPHILFQEEGWASQNELDVDYKRLAVQDNKMPTPEVINEIVEIGKQVGTEGTLFVQCQAGLSRTTTVMVIASLFRRLFEEVEEEEDEPQEEEEEEEEEEEMPEDMDEDEWNAKRAADKAERARLKEEERLKALAEMPINYKAGEFKLVMDLVHSFGPDIGVKYKAEVDLIIDRNAHIENIREALFTQKTQYDLTPSDELLERGKDYVERYALCILFFVYCKTNMEQEFETPYSEWLAAEEQQAAVALIGTREEGPLSEFRFV